MATHEKTHPAGAAWEDRRRALLGLNVHPKIVSEMLGHSRIAITLDLYSYVTPTMQREAARTVGVALFG